MIRDEEKRKSADGKEIKDDKRMKRQEAVRKVSDGGGQNNSQQHATKITRSQN